MKKYVVFLLVLILICDSWSIPKPMESIENYNVLMVHGAYGWNKGFIWPHMSEDYWEESYGYEDFKSEIRTRLDDVIDALDTALPSAYDDTTFLGKATLGSYTSDSRITRWLNEKVFEEKIYSKEYENVRIRTYTTGVLFLIQQIVRVIMHTNWAIELGIKEI